MATFEFQGTTRSPEQIAQMEREMANLQEGIRRIEATYGSNHLNLVLAVRYIGSLLANRAIDPSPR